MLGLQRKTEKSGILQILIYGSYNVHNFNISLMLLIHGFCGAEFNCHFQGFIEQVFFYLYNIRHAPEDPQNYKYYSSFI